MLPGDALQTSVCEHRRHRRKQEHATGRGEGTLGEPQHLALEFRRLFRNQVDRKAVVRKPRRAEDFPEQLRTGFSRSKVERIVEVPVEQNGREVIRRQLQKPGFAARTRRAGRGADVARASLPARQL